LLTSGARRLADAGVESARLDARVLLAFAMDVPPERLPFAGPPDAEQAGRYDAFIARRERREPLAYITGVKEFWSLSFAVGPGVLIPRPETELLIERACDAFPDRKASLRVLDLGTGSGCLLIAFLSEFPNAQGVGIDVSDQALGWAKRNASRLGVDGRASWEPGSWQAMQGRTFDAILANPPYLAERERTDLAPEIGLYEPPLALFAGTDGLAAYRALIPAIGALLAQKGWAGVEIGAGQADAVRNIVAGSGLEIQQIAPDLRGIPRCVAIRHNSDGADAEKTVGNGRSSR
jgi:release factor glutamine methyltransferase